MPCNASVYILDVDVGFGFLLPTGHSLVLRYYDSLATSAMLPAWEQCCGDGSGFLLSDLGNWCANCHPWTLQVRNCTDHCNYMHSFFFRARLVMMTNTEHWSQRTIEVGPESDGVAAQSTTKIAFGQPTRVSNPGPSPRRNPFTLESLRPAGGMRRRQARLAAAWKPGVARKSPPPRAVPCGESYELLLCYLQLTHHLLF